MKTNFSSEQEYINTIAPSVQKACKRYGYLPSVLIAQSCLENGYGIPSYWDNQQIKYLLQYNNMVGQKAELLTSSWHDKSVWPGKSFNKNTPQVYANKQVVIKDDFRIFDNAEQSFCDFILFLLYASNYGYNGKPKYGPEVVNIKDPTKLIKQVGSRGYATGPTYPTSVMRIVNKHNLTKYDDLSKVQPSKYIPNSLKTSTTAKIRITTKKINDITASNKSQIPAPRGKNPIQWIVIHYLGVPNADNPNLYGGGYGGHYNIKRDGSIYKVADPKTAIVWHCGGALQGSGGHQYYKICTNYNSIGIENSVCYTDTSVKSPSAASDKWYFTKETQESLIFLVSQLMDKYNIDINHVIRHYDVTGKICPNPYVKNNKLKTSWTWDEFKTYLKSYRKDGTYTPSSTPPSTNTNVPFTVSITVNNLEIKKGPGTNYATKGYTGKGTFTIVEKSGDWGKLKSGAGWIYLKNLNNNNIISKTSYLFNGLDYSPVFNPQYYSNKYADLKKAFGNNEKSLFNHFCSYGMKQGRQAIATFNVHTYKQNYSDLRKAFGSNLQLYYRHYIEYGKKENRKGI